MSNFFHLEASAGGRCSKEDMGQLGQQKARAEESENVTWTYYILHPSHVKMWNQTVEMFQSRIWLMFESWNMSIVWQASRCQSSQEVITSNAQPQQHRQSATVQTRNKQQNISPNAATPAF